MVGNLVSVGEYIGREFSVSRGSILEGNLVSVGAV